MFLSLLLYLTAVRAHKREALCSSDSVWLLLVLLLHLKLKLWVISFRMVKAGATCLCSTFQSEDTSCRAIVVGFQILSFELSYPSFRTAPSFQTQDGFSVSFWPVQSVSSKSCLQIKYQHVFDFLHCANMTTWCSCAIHY